VKKKTIGRETKDALQADGNWEGLEATLSFFEKCLAKGAILVIHYYAPV
jgi:hypothetical protein